MTGVDSFLCDSCGRKFTTLSGQGLIMIRVHPDVTDIGITIERKKARCPEEEVQLMARAEGLATKGGVSMLYQYFQLLLLHRTLGKGMSRKSSYRDLVDENLRELDVEGERDKLFYRSYFRSYFYIQLLTSIAVLAKQIHRGTY